MRTTALAALFGIGLAMSGAAYARTWSDPNGRVSFDAPSSWVMDVRRSDPQTIVLAGNADDECYVIATPNSLTAEASADAVRRTVAPLTEESWVATANSLVSMFPNHNAQLVSQSVDQSGFWPLRRAEFDGAERHVSAGVQSRPGLDLMAFCWTYGGPDATATYETLFRSLANPNDAAWQAEAEQQAAEREARAEPQPAPEHN